MTQPKKVVKKAVEKVEPMRADPVVVEKAKRVVTKRPNKAVQDVLKSEPFKFRPDTAVIPPSDAEFILANLRGRLIVLKAEGKVDEMLVVLEQIARLEKAKTE
jgi:hypothetical protein